MRSLKTLSGTSYDPDILLRSYDPDIIVFSIGFLITTYVIVSVFLRTVYNFQMLVKNNPSGLGRVICE